MLAEQIVYDGIRHYWMPFSSIRGTPTVQQVAMAWSDDPSDPDSWTWDGYKLSDAISPHLMKHDGTWYLFYGDRSSGSPYPISVATSSNVNGPFTFLQTVLTPGGGWEGSRLDQPYVFQRNDGKWILMYMGDLGTGFQRERSGYATADNITGPYTKYAGNPVLDFGPTGSYDYGGAGNPWVYEFDGVYYIGYTVSHEAVATNPWRTGLVTTTDWVNFEKQGYLLTGTNEFNCFRGGVTNIADTYVLPYTTRSSSGDSYQMAIATQPAQIDIIDNPEAVFDFYDDFEGTSLDISKWGIRNGNISQTNVSGGNLTLTATSDWINIISSKWVGMDYIQESYARHPSQPINGNFCEVGFSDYAWNTCRLLDQMTTYTTWRKHAQIVGSSQPIVDMVQTSDPNWHTFRVYRQSPNIAGYQVDDNPDETISSNVPTVNLPSFLMSYGSGGQFVADWTRIRKWIGSEITPTVGAEQGHAPVLDIAIYNTTCGKFDVRLKPDKDISTDNLSNIRFSVKWSTSTGVVLEDVVNSFGIDITGTSTDGGYNYALFEGTGIALSSWTATTEYPVVSFYHSGAGSGYSTFEIADDSYAQSNSLDYYAELTSTDATGMIYQNATDVYLGRCGEIKVLLQGPYDEDEMMSLDLAGNIPLLQPYPNEAPWNYTGIESLSDIDGTVIDWVLVELRSSPTTSVEKKAALLLEDGRIAQYNYINQGVHFDNTVDGSTYHIVVWHRNHMPVMTLTSTLFDGTLVDFTDETICYGTPNAEIELETGIYGMFAGDVTADGRLQYSGPGNDRGPVIEKIVNISGSNNFNDFITNGYWNEDINLNDTVLYLGSNNDRSYINFNLNTLVGPELNNIYTSLVPGALVESKVQGLNSGSFDILLAEINSNIHIEISNNKIMQNGLLDNIQFTLAWKTGDTEIADLLSIYTSDYNLTPQGEPVEIDGIKHQVFVSITPVNLPQTLVEGDKVTVLSFENPSGLNLTDRLWIADDEYTTASNCMYYVSVWGSDNTGTILSSPLGINDLGNGYISIYPNPVTSDKVHVEMLLDKEQDIAITVLDIQGKTITSEILHVNAGVSNNQIDLQNLSKGIYYIKVESTQLNTIKKIVKL